MTNRLITSWHIAVDTQHNGRWTVDVPSVSGAPDRIRLAEPAPIRHGCLGCDFLHLRLNYPAQMRPRAGRPQARSNISSRCDSSPLSTAEGWIVAISWAPLPGGPGIRVPRWRVTRNEEPSSDLAAVAPSRITSSGRRRLSWASSQGLQAATSCGVGRLVDAPVAGRLLGELEVKHAVGDPDLAAVDFCRFQRPVEQLAGRADERLAAAFLDVAGLLADDHDPRVLRARAEDRARSVVSKITSAAAGQGCGQFRQGCALFHPLRRSGVGTSRGDHSP